MNNCCQNIFELCRKNNCSIISFGTSLSDEIITLNYEFANIHQHSMLTISNGQPYYINLSNLNENACYNITSNRSDGSKYIFNIDGIGYDCIKIKTFTSNEI